MAKERMPIMILVRVTFQAQFGKAGEIVELMKRNPPADIRGGRILTDLSGPFDTVVFETVVESIDAYFRQLQEMFASDPSEEERAVYALVTSGTREFYTIEAET
jgi:hypothetical protein